MLAAINDPIKLRELAIEAIDKIKNLRYFKEIYQLDNLKMRGIYVDEHSRRPTPEEYVEEIDKWKVMK